MHFQLGICSVTSTGLWSCSIVRVSLYPSSNVLHYFFTCWGNWWPFVLACSIIFIITSQFYILSWFVGQICTFHASSFDLPLRTASSSLCSFAIALRVSFEDAPVIKLEESSCTVISCKIVLTVWAPLAMLFLATIPDFAVIGLSWVTALSLVLTSVALSFNSWTVTSPKLTLVCLLVLDLVALSLSTFLSLHER